MKEDIKKLDGLNRALYSLCEAQGRFTSKARPARLKTGLSLREVARQMKHDPGHVSRMERGLKPWTLRLAIVYFGILVEALEAERREGEA
jgi:hypothetical protein